MKRILLIVSSLFLLILSFPPLIVDAQNAEGPSHESDGSSGGSPSDSVGVQRKTKNLLPIYDTCPRFMGDEEIYDKVDDFRNNRASLQEEYTIGFTEWIWNLFGLNTLNQLIYGNPFCIWFDTPDPPELAYGLFPQQIKDKVVDPIFNLFSGIFFVALMLAMLIAGLKMSTSVVTGRDFSIVREMQWYFIAGMTLIAFWMGIDYLFLLNWSIVGALNDLLEGQGMSLGQVVIVASIDEFQFTDIIILLAEWILMLFLNFVYILRLFTITILMGIGGLVIIGLLFEKTRIYFKIWFLALAGAIFMQSVHALYFTIILLFVSLNEASFLFKMFLLIMFLPLSSMILGMMQMADANALTTSSAQRMVNAAAVGQRLLGRGKNALGNRGGDANMGNLKKTGISALAEGKNGWNTTKSAAQTAGSIAGLVAGSVIGGGGASLGANMGASTVGAAMQVPRNVTAGIKSIADTREKFKDSNIKENINDRRAYFGQMGESIGTIFGQGVVGRSIGNMASGVSSQRLMNSDELGGFGGVTMQDIVAKYPDALIQFRQTNEGSGFFMNNNGVLTPISPTGAADASMPDGLTRFIDYNYADSFNPSEMSNVEQLQHGSILKQVSDVQLMDSEGTTARDSSFNPSNINYDDYYSKGNPTADTRDVSDRIADLVGSYKGGDLN